MSQLRKIFVLWSLFLVWTACNPAVEKPALPEEKLARIMADLYVAESATAGHIGYAKDSLAQAYYAQVFEMHGTSEEEYERSLYQLSRDSVQFEALVRLSKNLLEPDTSKQMH